MSYFVSKNYHSKITRCLLRSPISFYDTNTVGAILTRFAQDANTVDASFTITMGFVASNVLKVFERFCVCMIACFIVSPALILILLSGYVILRVFHSPLTLFRNHVAKKRHRINSFFVLLNEGIPSIRATGRQSYFRQQLFEYCDEYADSMYSLV